MIASEDVRRVTFERAMRGYRCEDVDDYLKQVADSMDAWPPRTRTCRKSSSFWPSASTSTARRKIPCAPP